MAEIHLEKKERSIWPWIIGLLLLLLILWAVWALMRRPGEPVPAIGTGTATTDTAVTGTTPVRTGMAGAMPQQLQEYMSTCHLAEGTQPETMGREHEFSTNCFDLLANSMSAVAAQRPADANLNQQLETVRQQVSSIRESDPASLQHSNATRRAAEASADALATMQQAFAGTNQQAQTAVDAARQAAQRIQPTQPLLEQQDAIRSFFREAGNALQNMAAGGPTV